MKNAHTPSYRPDIDGLRAIAIIPVILFHARVPGFGGGFLGVDVFFVISGYLITSLIGREIFDRSFTYLSFWERRARRLLPPMFLVVAVSSAVAYLILLPEELKAFGQSVVSISLFSSNVYFWLKAGYFDAPAQTVPLLHTWSLAVEEQFYLLFPAVLIGIAAWKPRSRVFVVTGIGLASFAISVWWIHSSPSAAYYLLPSRAWELMLGATLALMRESRANLLPPRAIDALLVVGMTLVVIPVFLYTEATPFPGFAALVPCLGTALIIWVGDGKNHVGRLLDNRAMVFVGQLSYSLYLWHWPILVFFAMVSEQPLQSLSTIQVSAALAATMALSWMSFALVENPIRRRKVLKSRRTLFAAMGTSAGLLAAYGLAAHVGHGFEYRIPDAALRIADGARDRAREWHACNDMPLEKVNAKTLCRLGVADAPVKFVLWGDSHAHVLFPAVDRAAKETGVAGLHASLHSCPPVPGIQVASEWGVDCYDFNERIERLIEDGNFDAVVLAAHWVSYEHPGSVWLANEPSDRALKDILESRLLALIERFTAKGMAVFVFDEVPYPEHFHPAQFARAVWWGADPNSAGISVDEYAARIGPFANQLPDRTRFARISPLSGLCPNGSFCPAIMDGRSNYFDDMHLSTRGAERLTPAFRAAFQGVDWK